MSLEDGSGPSIRLLSEGDNLGSHGTGEGLVDPDYLYCLIRFVSFEWENLEPISNGESSRVGLQRVQLPLASLEEVKKAAPGAFVKGEGSTSSFNSSLPDIQVALEGVENPLAPKIRGGGPGQRGRSRQHK